MLLYTLIEFQVFNLWQLWALRILAVVTCHLFTLFLMCVYQTDSKVNGTTLSSPSTSSQRSDSSLPLLRVAASQTTDTMGKSRIFQVFLKHTCFKNTVIVMLVGPTFKMKYFLLVSGDDELSSPSQDASGLEEVMEQLNNTFPHSQGTGPWLQ